MRKKIAYIGEFSFPKGTAASVRVLAIGRILSECGYEVSFHGVVSEKESFGDAYGQFENFKYSNLIIKKGNILKKLFNRLMSGFEIIKLFDFSRPEYIILAGGYSRYLIPILAYSRKHNIKVIVDVVEWFDYSHLPGGKFGPMALDTHLALTRLMKRCDGIIAISSFLEKYFLQFNKNVVRVPILIDKNSDIPEIEKINSFDSEYLNLIYAGIPGKKDLIDRVILGLYSLINEGIKVKLHLVGPSKSTIEMLLGKRKAILEELAELIVFHGKVDQMKVPVLLANADFSVLIRPNLRYANAGFPTKFVESMNAGLPIICNLTSDIGMYLRNGENGFIMSSDSVESFIECVKKASVLSYEEKAKMKSAAKLEANKSFDYRNFIEPIDSLFLKINPY